MKLIYSISGAVFCLTCGLLLSVVPWPWTQVLLVGILLIGSGAVLLAIGLRAVVKEVSERKAAQYSAIDQRMSALLEAIQTLHALSEPLADLKLSLEQQKQNEIAHHDALLQRLEQSDSLIKKAADVLVEVKELDKRCLEAIFGELCDLHSNTAQGAKQGLETLSQLESHTEELIGTLHSFQDQQKRTGRKLTDAVEDINDAVGQQIQELKNSIEAQNEANRSSMAQIMDTYSTLTNQDFALLKTILEETDG